MIKCFWGILWNEDWGLGIAGGNLSASTEVMLPRISFLSWKSPTVRSNKWESKRVISKADMSIFFNTVFIWPYINAVAVHSIKSVIPLMALILIILLLLLLLFIILYLMHTHNCDFSHKDVRIIFHSLLWFLSGHFNNTICPLSYPFIL
jgi:hypothetical protein